MSSPIPADAAVAFATDWKHSHLPDPVSLSACSEHPNTPHSKHAPSGFGADGPFEATPTTPTACAQHSAGIATSSIGSDKQIVEVQIQDCSPAEQLVASHPHDYLNGRPQGSQAKRAGRTSASALTEEGDQPALQTCTSSSWTGPVLFRTFRAATSHPDRSHVC